MADTQSFEPFPARANGNAATIIYVLYLVGLLVGVTALIGLVIAYLFRDGAPPWPRTHYRYQIRTFWIALLYIVIGAVTTLILVGYLILLFVLVWYVIRCVRGLKLIGEGFAVPNPGTWWV